MTDTLNTLLDEMAGMHPLPAPRPEVVETVTPSGVTIRYEDKKHLYFLDGEKVPSVSSILGCLDKPALPWWGMKIGVQGVLELFRQEALRSTRPLPGQTFAIVDTAFEPVDSDRVVRLLTEHKLTVNHVRDKAGERGTTVHDALEAWAATGAKPDPKVYPDEQRGYVEGLLLFLNEHAVEPEATEIIVGSTTHGFAGRYDLRCWLATEPTLLDLKTSGSVYLEHFLQLEAYEGAGVECGYEPTANRVVLRVAADGSYELRESPATYDDFLAVLACYRATTALRDRVKKAAA